MGLDDRVLRWDIPVSEDDHKFAQEICAGNQPVFVISPCSSQRFRNYRNWRWENYAEVARHLHERHGAKIVLTGAATEIETRFGAEIQKRAPGPLINLIGKTSLKQLLAVIEHADCVICPDSGPAHMAAAVDTPVIGLYATSNRWRTGPYFSQELVVDAYPEAVQAEFGKPVDSLRWGGRVRDENAMDLISVEDVLAKTDTVLKRST